MPLTEHELRRHATPFSAPGEAGTLEQGFGAEEKKKIVREYGGTIEENVGNAIEFVEPQHKVRKGRNTFSRENFVLCSALCGLKQIR